MTLFRTAPAENRAMANIPPDWLYCENILIQLAFLFEPLDSDKPYDRRKKQGIQRPFMNAFGRKVAIEQTKGHDRPTQKKRHQKDM